MAAISQSHPSGGQTRLHPDEIVADAGRVHDEKVTFLADAIEDEIVDDPALFIEEQRVLALAVAKDEGVVREQSIEPRSRAGAAHFELAHVGNVENSD